MCPAGREAGKRRQKGAFEASFMGGRFYLKAGDTSNTGNGLRCGVVKGMTRIYCKKPPGASRALACSADLVGRML